MREREREILFSHKSCWQATFLLLQTREERRCSFKRKIRLFLPGWGREREETFSCPFLETFFPLLTTKEEDSFPDYFVGNRGKIEGATKKNNFFPPFFYQYILLLKKNEKCPKKPSFFSLFQILDTKWPGSVSLFWTLASIRRSLAPSHQRVASPFKCCWSQVGRVWFAFQRNSRFIIKTKQWRHKHNFFEHSFLSLFK